MHKHVEHKLMVLETVAPWTDKAEGVDIVCSAWKHAAVFLARRRKKGLRLFLNIRTWEFANRVLQVTDDGAAERLPMLAGTLSEGVAREFITFCKIYDDLPKPQQIINSPETIPVPREPSILFALTGTIAHNANQDNFGQLMKFIQRLPVEFQVVSMRETIRRNKTMMSHSAVQKWISESAASLFWFTC